MEDRAAWEREMVRVFLSEHDAPCPGCGYNLRGTPGDKCPECATPLALGIRNDDPRSRWEMVGAIGVVVCAIYFGVMLVRQAWWLFSGPYTSSNIGPMQRYFWMSLASQLILALGAAGWCVAMFAARRRKPRPSWACPTNAAAGILLGSFAVYLLVYGVLRFFI